MASLKLILVKLVSFIFANKLYLQYSIDNHSTKHQRIIAANNLPLRLMLPQFDVDN